MYDFGCVLVCKDVIKSLLDCTESAKTAGISWNGEVPARNLLQKWWIVEISGNPCRYCWKKLVRRSRSRSSLRDSKRLLWMEPTRDWRLLFHIHSARCHRKKEAGTGCPGQKEDEEQSAEMLLHCVVQSVLA